MAQKRDNGTGTIYQRTNKTCVGKIYLGVDETRKEKFKYFSGKSEAEVKKKIREYNQSGTKIETKKISLQEYLSNWLKTYKRGNIKPSSYDAIERTATNHILPNIGIIQLQEITAKIFDFSLRGCHECCTSIERHPLRQPVRAATSHSGGWQGVRLNRYEPITTKDSLQNGKIAADLFCAPGMGKTKG